MEQTDNDSYSVHATALAKAIAVLKQSQQELDKVFYPPDGDPYKNSAEFKAGKALCDDLTPEQKKAVLFTGERQGDQPMTLRTDYFHCWRNAPAWTYDLYIQLGGISNAKTDFKTVAAQHAFTINKIMTGQTDRDRTAPGMHMAICYHYLDYMLDEARRTGEYDSVKEIIPLHQRNIIAYTEAEMNLMLSFANTDQGDDMLQAYTHLILPSAKNRKPPTP